MSAHEYEITYTLRLYRDGSEEPEEIGFGASGRCADIGDALYAIQSDIQNDQWETEPGMPDPDEIKAEMEVAR